MTLRQVVAAALIVALGIVGASAIGQVSSADSAAFYDQQILSELRDIDRELEAIKYNTGAVCQDSSSGFSCKKF